MKNTIWQNDGTHGYIEWGSEYTFAVEGGGWGNVLYYFPRDVWERMKADWFYVTLRCDDRYGYMVIRLTEGTWQEQWGDDITISGDSAEHCRIVRKEDDGSYTLAINLRFGGGGILDKMDDGGMIFTGERYIIDEIYLDTPESPSPEPKPTVPETATIRDAKDTIDNGIDGVCSAIENDELKNIRPNMTRVAGAHKALDIWFNENV